MKFIARLKPRYLLSTIVVIFAAYLLTSMFIARFWTADGFPGESSAVGKGSVSNLAKVYENWKKSYVTTDNTPLSVGLLWNKALSDDYSDARGIARINLQSNRVQIRIDGLRDKTINTVWLIDAARASTESTRAIKIGQLTFDNTGAWLQRQLSTEAFRGFEPDRVVIARQGKMLAGNAVLVGTVSLFQKLYHFPQSTPVPWERTYTLAHMPMDAIASGIAPATYPDADLINDGRRIFFNETFSGNGRTCGSCHPEDNNFTLDPEYIATLADDDPLFVAERTSPNPLAANFEKPELMRKVGLILENTNGFGDLENNFTLRSVPHLLGMRTSLSPPSDVASDGTTQPPDQRTGWGGDGAPTNLTVSPQLRGTLRDFAVGAVTQHFTKTLARENGSDFRLPTEYELDALEAFMLSLGRQQEFDDLESITLKDERADRGRLNFMGVGLANGVPCDACHHNGGANTDPDFDFPVSVTSPAFEMSNRSFAPRVEELVDQPGDVVAGSDMPFDDGFGSGTNLFNVPTVIEAADTGPYFHANQVDTVEGLISFYTSQRHLRNGEVLPPIVGLNGSQVANVGAFMRVINADENARSAIDLVARADALRFRDRRTNINLAQSEIEDAIEVLEGGHLHFNDAVPLFRKASLQLLLGLNARAQTSLNEAREAMIARR